MSLQGVFLSNCYDECSASDDALSPGERFIPSLDLVFGLVDPFAGEAMDPTKRGIATLIIDWLVDPCSAMFFKAGERVLWLSSKWF